MGKVINWLWHLIETIFYWLIRVVENLFNIVLPEKTVQMLLQFLKFGIVGFSNSIVNYAAYITSLQLFRSMAWFSSADFLVAQSVAFVLSVLWSFYWNNRYVFVGEKDNKNSWVASLVKTFVAYSVTGLILSELLLLLWINVVGISEFLAPVINILICIPINFLLNKFWAFKEAS